MIAAASFYTKPQTGAAVRDWNFSAWLFDLVWSKYSNALQASKLRFLSPPPPRAFETDLAVRYLLALRGDAMDWKTMLAYITGSVDQELLLRSSTSSPRTVSFEINSRVVCT